MAWFWNFMGFTVVLWVLYFFWKALLRKVVVRDYEAGLLYRYGEFERVLKSGVIYVPRFLYDAEILDMRKKDVTVQGQEVLTADRAALKISLLLSYEIADPVKAAHNAQNYAESLDAAAQLAVKAAAADSTLADILDDRPEFEKAVRARVKTESDRMGIRPLSVEVRDIGFPQELNQMLGELAKNPRPAKKRPVRASR